MDILSGLLISLFILLVTIYIKFRTSHFVNVALKLPCYNSFLSPSLVMKFAAGKNDILDVIKNFLGDPKHNKDLTPFWLGPYLLVHVKNLSDLEQILTSTDLLKKSIQYEFLENWLGKGLLTSDGALWHQRRKLLTPTFHFKILEKFIDIFNLNLKKMIPKLSENSGKGDFNIEPFGASYSLDVIAETAMSTELHAQEKESHLARAIKEITECIVERLFKVLYYPSCVYNLSSFARKQNECKAVIDKNIEDMISKIRKEFCGPSIEEDELGQKRRVNFMQLLMTSENKGQLTDNDVKDEVNTFLFEGHDTTSSAINFALYLLSRHPKVQEKVYDEVAEILQGSSRDLEFKELQSLKYTERVIKETLRLYPSVPYVGRQVEKDFTLRSGHTLPAGTIVLIYIYGMHRDENVFPNPEKFDPDRFLPENCAGMNPYSYIPFSAGFRNCIGQKFAMLELKSVIAGVVRHFKLLPSGRQVKEVSHLILRSGNGVYVQVEKR